MISVPVAILILAGITLFLLGMLTAVELDCWLERLKARRYKGE